MTFGKRLKEFREQHGYTKADIASLMGVSNAAVEKWESDERRPPLHRAEKLGMIYGVTVNELIGDTLNEKQKIKAADVAAAVEKDDKVKKAEIREALAASGYSNSQIDDFFSMNHALFVPRQ